MQTDNYKLRLTWIDETLEDLQADFDSADEAFLHYATSAIFDISIDDIDPEDIIDGSGDKHVDVIRVNNNIEDSTAEIDLIQAKNQTGFGSNSIIKLNNGLKWVFEKTRTDVNKLKNLEFSEKIKEIRELLKAYGPSNLTINVYYVCKGDSNALSVEYLEELTTLEEKWTHAGFGKFTFHSIGVHELSELVEERDRAKKKIDIEFPIVYDTNRPSLIEYNSEETKAVICTVTGKALATLASTEPKDAIFDLNVRQFYGLKGKVNQDILITCKGQESRRFWFLNNGITMVCESFDLVKDPDNPLIKVKNAQIVNGCQTTVTIREAYANNELSLDVKVMLKIYATDNPSLVERITLTTNNQNKITDRDLRANDSVQRDFERIIKEKFNYYYERKNKQYRHLKGAQKRRIIPNSKAAQAYLAIVRNKPSNARGHLSLIWSDFYRDIFEEASAGDLVGAFLILKFCQQKAKEAKKRKSNLTKLEKEIRVYGMFHLCRIMGHFLLNDKWGHKNVDVIDDFINSFEESKDQLNTNYKEAVKIVKSIRQEDKKEHPISALYYKSGLSQNKLLKRLSK